MRIGGIEPIGRRAGPARDKELTIRTGSEEVGEDKAGRDCKWAFEKAGWVYTVVDGRSADWGRAKSVNCTAAMLDRNNCTRAAVAAAGIGVLVTATTVMSAKRPRLASSSVPQSL